MKILIIRCGQHKELLFKTLIRQGHEIIMLDQAGSTLFPLVDRYYTITNYRDTEEIYSKAREIFLREGCQAIFTYMNSPVEAIGRLSDEFSLNYLSERSAKIISSKRLFRDFQTENSDAIKFSYVKTIEEYLTKCENFELPFIVKPSDNASSVGVTKVFHKNEVVNAGKRAFEGSFNQEVLIEEYLQGDEYAIEILIVGGEILPLIITRKYLTEDICECIELLDVSPAPIDKEDAIKIESYFKHILKYLKIKNFILHIEFKYVSGGMPQIIEVNPRVAGGNIIESLDKLYGYNLYEVYFDIILKNQFDKVRYDAFRSKIYSSGYSAFMSFIEPVEQGFVNNIIINDSMKTELERDIRNRYELYVKKGDWLNVPKSNFDFRGSIYSFGPSPDSAINSANNMLSSINIRVSKNDE